MQTELQERKGSESQEINGKYFFIPMRTDRGKKKGENGITKEKPSNIKESNH